ncbi:hypothetical protein K490DRAFT_63968 [Saccharata proteae CBS 121410]|uniref:Zn(2)-C6 fungal-type domain-containing protein n=1 Tax=Saccharata proteae CBS 121410 TaxID=1314787 RepID=A0A6A5YD18_9PEZI|nr:hypothetical protein K490DRAFT_63968 [Saccharata proteae CBS 121410]
MNPLTPTTSTDPSNITTAIATTAPTPRLHAACDECRHRKLKCPSTTPPCARCAAENMHCHYSPQKPMGRPRKRRRPTEHEETNNTTANDGPNTIGDSGNHEMVMAEFGLRNGGRGYGNSAELTPPEDDLGDVFAVVGDGFAGLEWDGGFLEGVGLGGGLQEIVTPPLLEGRMGMGIETEFGGVNAGSAALMHRHQHPSQSQSQLQSQTSALTTPPNPSNPSTSSLPTCACLSTMYLTITNLTTAQQATTAPFPILLPPLRAAIATSSHVLHCPSCPTQNSSAAQNLYQLASLLMTITDVISRALRAIDEEAGSMEEGGATKAFAIADPSVPTELHTGTADCPARFDMQMSGPEWRGMARRVIQKQLVGEDGDDEGTATLFGVVNGFLQRQERWHSDEAHKEERIRFWGEETVRMSDENKEARVCRALVMSVKMGVVRLGL